MSRGPTRSAKELEPTQSLLLKERARAEEAEQEQTALREQLATADEKLLKELIIDYLQRRGLDDVAKALAEASGLGSATRSLRGRTAT